MVVPINNKSIIEKKMRSLWFEHVAKTRKKLSTKKNPCSHRDAMKKASETWEKVKKKHTRALKKKGTSVKKEKAAPLSTKPELSA